MARIFRRFAESEYRNADIYRRHLSLRRNTIKWPFGHFLFVVKQEIYFLKYSLLKETYLNAKFQWKVLEIAKNERVEAPFFCNHAAFLHFIICNKFLSLQRENILSHIQFLPAFYFLHALRRWYGMQSSNRTEIHKLRKPSKPSTRH